MPTLREAAQAWRSGTGGRVCSPRHEVGRRRLLKRLLERYGDQPAADLTAKWIWECQHAARDDGCKVATVNRFTAAVLAFARDHEREQIFPRGFHAELQKNLGFAREPKTHPNRPFSRAERDKILAAAKRHLDPAYVRFVHWQFLTGTRISEALGLRYENLELGRRLVYICESRSENLVGNCKNADAVRQIPLAAALCAIMSTMPSGRPRDYVFQTPAGRPIHESNFDDRVWYPLLETAGVAPRRFRCTRHTYTSIAFEHGMSFAELAALTGDNAITLENFYRYFTREVRQINVDKAIGGLPKTRAAKRPRTKRAEPVARSALSTAPPRPR